MGAIRVGDYVQLLPRERPYNDSSLWWWRVLNVDDLSLDCVYERAFDYGKNNRGTRVYATRFGVDHANVRAHRSPNEVA